MPARTAQQTIQSPQKLQRELADLQLVMRARNGDQKALDELIRRYTGFVRLKASSYFLAGGDSEDLIQEGLIGLFKHSPLNSYVSFSHTPAGQDGDGDCTLGDALPGPSVDDPSVCVISTEELQSLVFTLGSGLSKLEADALKLYLEGESYEDMAERLGCDTKTIDNALQRVKRKVLAHQQSRQVLQ